MISALQRESRIEVHGSLKAGRLTTSYLLQYQSGQREYLEESGGVYSHVVVGKHRIAGVRQISVGLQAYRSIDGIHWTALRRSSPPSSLDVLSLNAASAACCTGGARAGTRLGPVYSETWHDIHVYVLHFYRAVNGQVILGAVRVGRTTYLPLEYTDRTLPPAQRGSFTIHYGGHFNIKPPR
jgi:hypothetical protein